MAGAKRKLACASTSPQEQRCAGSERAASQHSGVLVSRALMPATLTERLVAQQTKLNMLTGQNLVPCFGLEHTQDR